MHKISNEKLESPFADPDVNEQEDAAHDEAYRTNNDVRKSKKRILSTEPRSRRQYHSLRATKLRNWISCIQH